MLGVSHPLPIRRKVSAAGFSNKAPGSSTQTWRDPEVGQAATVIPLSVTRKDYRIAVPRKHRQVSTRIDIVSNPQNITTGGRRDIEIPIRHIKHELSVGRKHRFDRASHARGELFHLLMPQFQARGLSFAPFDVEPALCGD